jgi:hypothetical protein
MKFRAALSVLSAWRRRTTTSGNPTAKGDCLLSWDNEQSRTTAHGKPVGRRCGQRAKAKEPKRGGLPIYVILAVCSPPVPSYGTTRRVGLILIVKCCGSRRLSPHIWREETVQAASLSSPTFRLFHPGPCLHSLSRRRTAHRRFQLPMIQPDEDDSSCTHIRYAARWRQRDPSALEEFSLSINLWEQPYHPESPLLHVRTLPAFLSEMAEHVEKSG